MITIKKWLETVIGQLKNEGLPTPQLDAELLLADLLEKDRSWLAAHDEETLSPSQTRLLAASLTRRLNHEPIAYICGKQEFYGREFIVSADTLTPRPETETMIDLLKQISHESQATSHERLQVIDVGTGSGCIIITAALELAKISNLTSKISFLGLDISEPALEIARKNAKKHNVSVDFQKFDLTQETLTLNPSVPALILANLPYVPNDFHINTAATHEPDFAIFGGADGLDYYRELFKQISRVTGESSSVKVFTEALPPQHKALRDIAESHGFVQTNEEDFIQCFRSK